MNLRQMIERQQQILDAARTAGRGMTAEEIAEFESLQRSIDAARAAGSSGTPDGGNGAAAGAAAGTQQRGGEEGSEDGEADTQEAQRAVQMERQRIQTISDLCREFGMESRSFIENGTTAEQMYRAVVEHQRATGQPIQTGAHITDSAEDKFRRAAVDSLLMRGNVSVDNPADGARQMMGMSLRDLAIECMIQDGTNESGLNRKSADDIFSMMQRAFFTPEAAFPSILDNAIEKAYKEGHRKVAVTFDRFTKKGSLADFKTHDNYYVAGPVGEFLEVPENGELKHDSFKDAKLPSRKLKTYGRQFTLSRKAFIDDDISLVVSLPARYAASARRTINKQVYGILLNNPKIFDGVALFGKEHKNLLKTGTGITQEAMQTMIMALSNQKDQFGQSIIINPATIVVPSGMQFEMYTLFNSPTINTEGNTQAVNPLYQYRDRLEVVEDPTINAMCGGLGKKMPWFLIGDPGDCDGIEVDYLNGQEIPNIRRMEVPGQLGLVWDIYLDWGISVMDFRGMVKNPGVEVNTKLELE
nr:hypothetical protein [uncultured Dysosmobacter sp.]